MRSGDLNKRVELQAPTLTPDGMGGFSASYSTVATVYCAIWPVSSTDVIAANSTSLVITHRLRIRYRSVLKTSWRVSWAGRYFAIVSIIDPSMEHKWLDLMTKESTG